MNIEFLEEDLEEVKNRCSSLSERLKFDEAFDENIARLDEKRSNFWDC